MKFLRILARGLYFLVLAILVCVLIAYLFGVRPYSVISGSMVPTLRIGTVCFVDRRYDYDNLQVGDIIVYQRRSDDKMIIHRVIDITDSGIETKGDHNSVSDGISTGPDNFVGKSLFYVHYLGYLSIFLQTVPGRIVIAVLVVLFIWVWIPRPRKPDAQE